MTRSVKSECVMHPDPQPRSPGSEELEAAVDQAMAACGSDTRTAVRVLIVANDFFGRLT